MAEKKDVDAVDAFFERTAEPKGFEAVRSSLHTFLESLDDSTRLAFVTSGGTDVPLEKNTVRSIVNFSTGTRGALSAEHFLRQGYAVIFLTRRGSKAPFGIRLERALSSQSFHSHFFDLLEFQKGDNSEEQTRISLKLNQDTSKQLAEIKNFYNSVRHLLLTIDFSTVHNYFFWLREISQSLNSIGNRALMYMAAAVSDFYIPESDMETHKIQSDVDGLTIQLSNTPKLLGLCRTSWASEAFFVSFKLETDESILSKKAKRAMEKYGMNAVVANLLHTRAFEVVVFSNDDEQKLNSSTVESQEIEELIIAKLKAEHNSFINR